MTDSKIIYRKMVNYMYKSMCRTMEQLPFSGQHWLEQLMFGVSQCILDDYGSELENSSQKPENICRAYLDLLDDKGFIDANDYYLEGTEDGVIVRVDNRSCVYRQYCLEVLEEGLPFSCIRLAAFQAVLRQVLVKEYTPQIYVDWENGICEGKLFYSSCPREDIVTREGHELKIAGRRAILLTQETYISLLTSINEHAPHALKHVLYDAGYRSGVYLARKAREMYDDNKECLQFLLREIEYQGMGRPELISFDELSGRAEIHCYDSFQVAAAEEYGHLYRSPQVICDLLRGIFAAYLGVLLDRETICEELHCQSVQGNYCEFIAIPVPRYEKKGDSK
ncbi:MAG: 4-vinyl reductase [Clostridiales bacterium]|nr:4-vinyl reductase [Clostridiales bacterium]MCF8022066.1 4-vinyl reductase [Clostridiales bacterium]